MNQLCFMMASLLPSILALLLLSVPGFYSVPIGDGMDSKEVAAPDAVAEDDIAVTSMRERRALANGMTSILSLATSMHQ